MTYPMMQHIPLMSAYLCQDCNSVGNCAVQCPACASSVLLNLSGILDREIGSDHAGIAYTFTTVASIPPLTVGPERAAFSAHSAFAALVA